MKPYRHVWDEGSTHRSVAGKEYDEAWGYAEQLKAENDALRNTISLLKNENERLTDRVEELEADIVDYRHDLNKAHQRVDNAEAENEALWKQKTHLQAILGVLNTNNEIASLHDAELWSLHGELQQTVDDALLEDK